ncbi:MAG TPA: EthD family reductase [Sphingomonas sp.]|jgi:uncharacterized protein (TIGR02118 family)|uniref:EthD family reductase n=1 Tax=Sphingomonas sp. TaxID=28214 RepID=UPI002ED8FE5F
MAILMVLYPTNAGTRFDADYYVGTHMPLVRDAWTQHGLVSAEALLPDQPDPAFAAVAMLTFRDASARDAALAGPEAAAVFADVPRFTDISPVAQLSHHG